MVSRENLPLLQAQEKNIKILSHSAEIKTRKARFQDFVSKIAYFEKSGK